MGPEDGGGASVERIKPAVSRKNSQKPQKKETNRLNPARGWATDGGGESAYFIISSLGVPKLMSRLCSIQLERR